MSRRGAGRRAKPVLWLCLSLVSVGWPTAAYADLGADVRALLRARTPLAKVIRNKPRLLERGDQLPLTIPAELLDPKDPSCTTITLLGVLGAHFMVRFSRLDPGSSDAAAHLEASVGGGLEITRCGSSKPYLGAMLVEMRSPRGVIETLISNARVGLPRLSETLPERDPGTELELGDPGPGPSLPPLGTRLGRLAARAQREGAESHTVETLHAATDGTGSSELELLAGCHELTLLAASGASGAPAIDLDLELVDRDSGERLAQDRRQDADTAIALCVGSPVHAALHFVGALPGAAVSLVHVSWELPRGLPIGWGPEPRARLAQLARAQRLRLQEPPLYGSLGVQGSTQLSLEVEPGRCYSALLVALRGEAHTLSLSIRAEQPGETTHGASIADGSAVSFCVHGARRATIEVEADGASLAWLLGVWATGRTAPGISEP